MPKSSQTASAAISAATHPQRRILVLAGLILAVAAALRGLSALGGLWLDEIWTLLFALDPGLTSPWDILTRLHHENNHYLNTFCVRLLGPQADWRLYRLPPIVAGTAAVALAGLIGRRRGDSAAILAMLLVGCSYVLIHYSSEGRGYSFAVCAALACLDCQERLQRGSGWPAVVGTAASAIAGILAQPVFLAFYGAILVWSAWKAVGLLPDRRRGWWKVFGQWALCHIPPLAFFAWLYAVDLGQVHNAGGPQYSPWEVVLETFSLAVGGPDGAGKEAAGLIVALMFLVSLVLLWKADRDWCVLASLAIVALPALLVIVTGRKELYPRYFVIPVALLNLTFAFALSTLWKSPRPALHWLVLLLLAAALTGNVAHVWRLIDYGRGGYLPAVAYMAEQTTGNEIRVGSDHDFRNGMVLSFYAQYLPESRRLKYYRQNEWPAEGPEWLLLHELDRRAKPKEEVIDPRGRRFRLAKFYPYAGLSGWSWALYRNEGAGR